MDRILVTIPRLHCMQHGKNYCSINTVIVNSIVEFPFTLALLAGRVTDAYSSKESKLDVTILFLIAS